MMSDQVATLNRLGYFGGWNADTGSAVPGSKAKAGVLSFDTPTWNRPVAKTLLPRLRALGRAPAPGDVIAVPAPDNYGDAGRMTAAIQSAVLKFRTDGVTHVILLDNTGQLSLFFTTGATNQGYHPRIGVNSATSMQALVDSGASDGRAWAGAMGLGWKPSFDLSAQAATKYETRAGAACLKLLTAKTGQRYASVNERAVALIDCNFLAFVDQGLDFATTRTRNGFRTSIEGFARTFADTTTLSTLFSPTHHDGLTGGYDMKWDSSCTCTRYVGSHLIP
jgi:hypothetical protein